MDQRSALGGVLLTLGAATAYGLNITSARIAAQAGIGGPTLIVWRVIVMLVLAAAAAWLWRRSLAVAGADRRGLAVLGLASAGVGLCYLSSVAFIPVAVAAVVFYTFPVLIVLASPLVDKRPLTPTLLGIALLAFAGVVMVVGPALDGLDPRGLVLAFGASLCAVVQFYGANRCAALPTLTKVVWVQAISLPAAWAAALATGGLAAPAALAAAPWAVAFTICGFIIGFVLHMMALARVGAVVAGMVFCVEPVIAVITAALVLGEALTPLQGVGGACVVAAILLTVRRERSDPVQTTAEATP